MSEPNLTLVMPAKPAQGSPCNRCGVCCISVPCPIAEEAFDLAPFDRCPALERGALQYSCGLVTRPSRYFPAVAAMPAEVRDAFDADVGPQVRDCLGNGTCDSAGPEGLNGPAVDEARGTGRQAIAWMLANLRRGSGEISGEISEVFAMLDAREKETPCPR